jgi:thiosulfate/3-mercaptopyruvate sulfurtransferase
MIGVQLLYPSITQVVIMSSTTDQYAHGDVLVDTDWVLAHHKDLDVKIAEVDYDPAANYNTGHIPGAVLFDWKKDINDPLNRDVLSKAQLEQLFSRAGITNDTWVVLYGDFNNWFAAFAFWVFKYYKVERVKILNGGRKKWLLEDKPVTKDIPTYAPTSFKSPGIDDSIRVFKEQVIKAVEKKDKVLVDVRGPKEFSGEILAPPEYPTEHAQRGGHIPGAKNIPWAQAVNDADGTFKGRKDLEALYTLKGVTPDKDVIAYCRIGERSSHTWFVLKYLLGYPDVKNYDGSWTEWGNSVRLPIER